jgi:tetratricopeptide (TPR) repeat protein
MTQNQAVRLIPFLFVAWLGLAGCTRGPEKTLQRGEAAIKAGKWADAEIEFRKLAQEPQYKAESALQLGKIYRELGRPSDAYAVLMTAWDARPNHVPTQLALAEFLLPSYWADERRPQLLYEQLDKLATQMLAQDAKSFWGHRIRGYLAVTNRKFADARGHFEQALAVEPNDLDSGLMLMQTLFSLDQIPTAVELAKKLEAAAPNDASIPIALARRYVAAGRIAEAEAVLLARQKRTPGLDWGVRLATFYYETKQLPKAQNILNDLESHAAQIPEAWLALATYYQNTGQTPRALVALEQAQKGPEPGARKALQQRLRLLGGAGATEQYQQALSAGLDKYPQDADLKLQQVLFGLNRAQSNAELDAAITSLRGIIEKQPKQAWLYTYLGKALMRQQKWAEARQQLTTARQLDPDDPEPRLYLVRVSLEEHDLNAAARESEALMDVAPENESVRLARFSVLRTQGRFGEARAMLQELKRVHPGSPSLVLEEAFLSLSEGKPAAAESFVRKLYRAGHPDVRVVAALAEALTAQGRYTEAIPLLTADLQVAPGRPLVQFALAECYLRSRQLPAAEKAFEDLRRLSPTSPEAHQRLASLYAQSGREDQAEAMFRAWQKVQPTNPIPFNDLAYFLAERRVRLDDAEQMARRALEIAPRDLNFLDTLGFVHLQQGRPADATKVFREMLAQKSDLALGRFRLGQAFRASGQPDLARREWEQALQLNPEPPLREMIRKEMSGKL